MWYHWTVTDFCRFEIFFGILVDVDEKRSEILQMPLLKIRNGHKNFEVKEKAEPWN